MKRQLTLTFALLFAIHCFGQKHTDYYNNGQKKYQERKKDGHFKGKRVWWYENGQKKSEGHYNKSGVIVKMKQWDKDGNLITNQNLKKEQKKSEKKDLSKMKWTYQDQIGFCFTNKGSGVLPSTGDTVILHYIGYFENGEQFDNSYKRGQPLQFEVGDNYLLKSFTSAAAKFKQGQKGYIKIPPELAYGDKPTGNIPANSTLIYFIEIIAIK